MLLTNNLSQIPLCLGQTPEDKIKFLFKVYDIDGKLQVANDEWKC